MPTLQTDGKIARLGAELTKEQMAKLSGAPDPAAIFEHMDLFNEEIAESYSDFLQAPEETTTPVVKPVERKLSVKKKEIKPISEEVRRANKPIIRKRDEVPMEDLSAKLDELVETAEETVATPEEDEAKVRVQLYKMLADLKGPGERQIGIWHNEHGKDGVHITVFSPTEIYVYTHLTRTMWTKVQETMQKLQTVRNAVSEEELKETVVKYCIKWPVLTPEWKYNARAGVIDALYQAIMLQSYFLNPAQVMQITHEL